MLTAVCDFTIGVESYPKHGRRKDKSSGVIISISIGTISARVDGRTSSFTIPLSITFDGDGGLH